MIPASFYLSPCPSGGGEFSPLIGGMGGSLAVASWPVSLLILRIAGLFQTFRDESRGLMLTGSIRAALPALRRHAS